LLVHDGDHGVSGVRHNSAENTSPVTSHEGDHKLEVLGVALTGSGENVLVEGTDGLLESNELHDGVGDLSAPEGSNALVEAVPALSLHDLGPRLTEGGGEGALVRSLHSNFSGFEGAERDVGDELSAGGGDGKTDGLVLGGVLLADSELVDIFEDLVEAELAEALSTVTHESWEPAESEALEALSSVDDLEAISNTLVHLGVGLFAALDNIKGANEGVRKTAGKNTASHTLGVVGSIVNVTHFFVFFFQYGF